MIRANGGPAPWLWRAGVAFALVTVSGGAAAEDVRLAYAADEPCPSQAVFEDQVRARTARARFAPEAARSFDVALERRGERWIGTLRVGAAADAGRAPARTLEGESCAETAAALALVLALAIDPGASTAPIAAVVPPLAPATVAPSPPPPEVSPPPPEVSPPPPEVSAARPSPPPSAAPPHRGAPARVFWGADAEISTPLAPAAMLGGAIFAEVSAGRARTLRLSLAFTSSVPFEGTTPAARFFLAIARVSACPGGLTFGPRVAVLVCGSVGAGLVHGAGIHVAIPDDADAFWAELGAGAVFRAAPSDRTFVEFGGGALAPLTRPTFVFRTPRVVIHQVDLLGATATVAVGARFW